MEHISKSGTAFKIVVHDFIDHYDAAHLLDRQAYVTPEEMPGILNSAMSWLFKLADFRITPTLLGTVLVLALTLTYIAPSRFLPSKTSKRIRNWAISTIPIFFTGLIFQFVSSLLLLAWGGFELYFSFSFLWFGADLLHIVIPISTASLALILWYVLKRNHYIVYYRADVYSWNLIRYLFVSIFIFQQAKNFYFLVLWIPLLGNAIQWILNLPGINVIRDIITTPSYISIINGLDNSFIFKMLLTFAINSILPIFIKRTIKFVYRSFKIKIEEGLVHKPIGRDRISNYHDYIYASTELE